MAQACRILLLCSLYTNILSYYLTTRDTNIAGFCYQSENNCYLMRTTDHLPTNYNHYNIAKQFVEILVSRYTQLSIKLTNCLIIGAWIMNIIIFAYLTLTPVCCSDMTTFASSGNVTRYKHRSNWLLVLLIRVNSWLSLLHYREDVYYVW